MMIEVQHFPSTVRLSLGNDSGYFPVVTTTGKEDIVIVYRAGAGHMGISGRLEAISSRDEGATWSEPAIVACSELDDRNPSVGVTDDGAIVVAYHRNGNYVGDREYDTGLRNFHTYLTRSEDGGRTWQKPYKLDLERFYGFSPYGQMLTLKDGSLLMPIYGSRSWRSGGSEPVSSCLLRSDDDGMSWRKYSVVAEDEDEAAFLILPDGRMLAALRSEKDSHLSGSFSNDMGRNWQPLKDLTGPSQHPACLTLLHNGYVLLSYGYRAPPYGARGLISEDYGRTWLRDREIIFGDDAPNWDCGYPSTIRLNSGKLVTAYYSTAKRDSYSCEGAKLNVLFYEESELLLNFE